LIGPDATAVTDKDHLDTDHKNINEIINTAKRSLPHFDLRKTITAFAGNRSASSNDDFIIEASKIKGFINVAGIESPGLTAAPAIAPYVVEIIAATGLVKLNKKIDFNPYRKPYHTIAHMNQNDLNNLIKQDAKYGCVICRCETVSAGEICDALYRNIPINSLDAIKRRTRAGMGRCQGGFCTPKVMEIIHNELKTPKEKITKKGGKSLLVFSKDKS
jgi:glycerol-3-phosphate dehydrogenase